MSIPRTRLDPPVIARLTFLHQQRFMTSQLSTRILRGSRGLVMNSRIKTSVTSILVVALFSLPMLSASASTGYRYWGYFQAAPSVNQWTMAMTGPTTNVKDGSVEGWIHTFSNDEVNASAPRLAPDFAKLCKKVKPAANKKRVGIVIDFGPAAIRPQGESIPKRISTCVQVDLNATGAEVLAQVTKIRAASSGFICGINGYPAKECSAEIKTPRSFSKLISKLISK